MNWIDLIKTAEAKALMPVLSPDAKTTLKYLAGDYWQGMDAWAGTRAPSDALNRAVVEAELERMFVPQPLIEETTRRFVDAVVGHEPSFGFVSARATETDVITLAAFERIKEILKKQNAAFGNAATRGLPSPGGKSTPAAAEMGEVIARLEIEDEMNSLLQALGIEPEEEEEIPGFDSLPLPWKEAINQAKEIKRLIRSESAVIAQANAAIGTWWDMRNAHETVYLFAEQLASTGRACLRVFVPAGLLPEGGASSKGLAEDWKSALDMIYLECPAVESAAVAVDRQTMKEVSLFTYKEKITNAEGKEEEVDRVEISFLNDAGETVIRILQADDVIKNGEAIQDIGGELYADMAEMTPLISAAAHRLQNALNVINSMILKNGDLAGFRERNYINLQRPKTAIGPDPDDPNKTIYEDADLEVGSDAANFLTGITYKDKEGNTNLAQGSIVISEPVSPEPLVSAAERFERCYYQSVSQLHVLISGDATASAVSRVQARAEFVVSLLKMKPKVEGVLRSRLRAVLLLAAFLANDTPSLDSFKALRARVDCRIDPGPITPEERLALITLCEKRLVSRETAQVMLGIEDVDAEVKKLHEEEESSQSFKQGQAAITQLFSAAGAGIEASARAAGVDEKVLESFIRSDFVEDEDQDVADVPPQDDESTPVESIDPERLRAGITANKTLNGAQVTAALEVLDRLVGGSDGSALKIAPIVAIEFLAAVGMQREVATTIVNASK